MRQMNKVFSGQFAVSYETMDIKVDGETEEESKDEEIKEEESKEDESKEEESKEEERKKEDSKKEESTNEKSTKGETEKEKTEENKDEATTSKVTKTLSNIGKWVAKNRDIRDLQSKTNPVIQYLVSCTSMKRVNQSQSLRPAWQGV
jgi:TATA-binding protein-associated factor Taf7